MRDHVIIPDTQVKPGIKKHELAHIWVAANYINEHRPEVVVMLGDWWDMPSLNSYAKKGSTELSGKKIKKDIEAGNHAMEAFMSIVDYWPEFHFILGNHEERLYRLAKHDEAFEGLFDDAFFLDGWEVHDFLDPVCVDGVYYSHYFVNPFTGRPYGGGCLSQLKNLGFSFTAGHKQVLDIARIDRNNGEVHQGLVAGAFYQHDEGYKGAQGNHHWRGFVHKKGVANGQYDLETITIERLLRDFK